MSKPYFRCIVCDHQLEPAIDGIDDRIVPVHGGLFFRAFGNYGSTLFDPSPRSAESHLEIVICDPCAVRRQERIRLFLEDGTVAPLAGYLARCLP